MTSRSQDAQLCARHLAPIKRSQKKPSLQQQSKVGPNRAMLLDHAIREPACGEWPLMKVPIVRPGITTILDPPCISRRCEGRMFDRKDKRPTWSHIPEHSSGGSLKILQIMKSQGAVDDVISFVAAGRSTFSKSL